MNRFTIIALGVLLLFGLPYGSFSQEEPSSPDVRIKPADHSGQCYFRNPPVILRDEPGSFLQYWVEEDLPVFQEAILPESASLHDFRNQIQQLLDTDQMSLLKDQLTLVTGGDAVNVELALRGEAGKLREIHCLEAILLSFQTDRSIASGKTMLHEPTEFLSYILTKGDSIKVYLYTVDQPGIRGLSILSEPIDQDRLNGWEVKSNLHNHNFFPNSDFVLGGVAPSATDVQAFRNAAEYYGMSRALITNGFHTLDISREDFKRFSAGKD